MDLNGALFEAINQSAGHVPLVDDVMKFVAQYGIYAVALIAVASWFSRGGTAADHRIAVYTALAATALALAVTLAIQHAYVHQRPFVVRTDVVQLVDHSPDASFPSEHATAAFALAAGIGLYRWRLGAALLVLAAWMAVARVYVGIHYPGDVAGGALIGVLAAVAFWWAQPLLAWLDRTVVLRLVPEALR